MKNFTRAFANTKSKLNIKGLLAVFVLLLTMQTGWGQSISNGGFESNTTYPGTGWTGVGSYTSGGSIPNTGGRTGSNYLVAPSVTSPTAYSNYFQTTSSINVPTNSYLHFICWAKTTSTTSTTQIWIGEKISSITNTLVQSPTTFTQFSVSIKNTGSATTGLSSANAYPAVGLNTSASSRVLWVDDAVAYVDNVLATDLTKPVVPTLFTNGTISSSSVGFSWTAGSDAGTGIQNTIILRTTNSSAVAPVMNDQGIYSTTGTTSGPNTVSTDWTVLSTTVGASTLSYTDTSVTSGISYKYAVIHRDLAFNYSTALVSGTIIASSSCTSPSTQASSLTANTTTTTTSNYAFTRGNGSNVLVVARLNSTAAVIPTSGTSYTANAAFTSGNTTGTGNYVVYNGAAAGTSTATGNIAITGLTAGNYYTLTAYEYATTGSCYNTTSPASGNFYTLSTAPTANPASFTAAATSTTAVGLSFTAASSITNAYGYLIFQKASSASGTTFVPTNGTAYTVGTTYGDGTLAANIVSTATTTSAISALTANTQYTYTIVPYSYDGTNAATLNYYTTSNKTATATTLAIAPTIAAVTNQTVDNNFNITFTDNATWRAAVTGITVDGTSYITNYTFGNGTLALTTSAITQLQTAGSHTIVVKATGYTDASVTQTNIAGAASKLAITTQPTAPASNGAVLAAQPVVKIQDQYGNTTTSTANVVAAVEAGSWTLGGTLTQAGVAGTATFTGLTATSLAAVSGATITFTCGSLTSATSTPGFNIVAPVITLSAVTNQTVDNNFNITFTDNATWRAAVTSITVGGTSIGSNYTFGNGTLALTTSSIAGLQTAGSKNIVVIATGYVNASVTQTNIAGVPAAITMTTQPVVGATSGAALATMPVVTVKDQYTNVISGSVVTAAVTSGQGSSWTLGGAPQTATTNASGVATFTTLTATNTTSPSAPFSTASLTFAPGTGAGSVTSSTFTIKGIAPTITAASGATVDAAFDATFTENATWRAAITGITVGGTPLTAGYSTATAGKITFTPSLSSTSTLLQSAGINKSIVVTATNYPTTTFSQTIGAGVPTAITMTTQPAAPATSGALLATMPVVTVKDQYANVISGSVVTAAVTSGQGSSWTLGGASQTATTNASGVATFTTLTATNTTSPSAPYSTASLTFAPGTGTGSVTSSTFIIKGIAPTITAASGATVDAAFDATFTDNATWRAAITGITLGGTALTAGYSTATAEKITFTPSSSSPASLLQTATTRSIIVTATGYPTTTFSQVIGSGAASKLAVTTQPTAPTANGGVLAQVPVVAIQDQYGNATTSTASITATAGGGTWTIGGATNPNAATSGTVTFTGMTATSAAAVAAANIVFSCASPSLVSATSTPNFVIPAPAPANDACSGAISLTNGSATNGTTVASTYVALTSDPYAYSSDVWYSFTAVSTGTITVSLSNSAGIDYDLFAYATNCPTDGTGIATGGLTSSTSTESMTIAATSGVKYLIRVATWANASGSAIVVTATQPLPPANDLCSLPAAITINGGGIAGTTIAATYTTLSNEPYTTYSDVWYSFTAPSTGTATVATTTSATDYDLSAYSSCPTSAIAFVIGGNGISSSTTAESMSFAVTSGTVYYIRVGNTTSTAGSTFTITATMPVPAITGTATATAFTTTYGTASTAQTFTVSGSNLSANLVATAPTGYQVSSDGTTYGTTATFTQTSGSASGSLKIRLAPTAAVGSDYNSKTISLESSPATTLYITTASTGNTVSAKALTVTGLSLSASSKVYDGTTSASALISGPPSLQAAVALAANTSSDGKPITGDVVSLNSGTLTGAFNSKDVASATTVTYDGYSLTGTNATNYSLNLGSSSATITAKALTMTGLSVPASKTYNGNTTAVVTDSKTLQTAEAVGAGTTSDGIPYTGDVVSISGTATGTYNDANVVSATTVSFGGLSLTGAQSGNYSLTIQSPQAATITKANQTITFASTASASTTTADYAPGATSASSATNPITYASNNAAVATIVSNQIHIVGVGPATITASQAASANYNAAADVTQTLTVTVNTDVFRSKATGNWNTAGTWESAATIAGTFVTATTTPGANNPVYIQSGHTVTLTQNESVNDLHIASGTALSISGSAKGTVALSTFTLSVNGKLRDYYASVGTIPGTNQTGGYPSYPFTASTGKVSIVGNSRTVFTTGEWGATVTATSANFPLEINMNAGQTATATANIKCSNLKVVTGTLDAVTIGLDNGTVGQGDVTIASGATIISSASSNNVFQKTTSALAGTLTVNGTLVLTGVTPFIQMTTIVFNGTVEYSASGTQTLAVLANGGASPNTYTNLKLSGTSAKTLGVATTVNGTLTIAGTASLALNAKTLTYGGSSTLEYAGSVAQTTSTAAELSAIAPTVKINNASGVSLGQSVTLTALDLTSGIVTTDVNVLTIAATGSVSNASATSYVYGNLNKFIAASITTKNFEIGDATIYAPVSLTFTGTISNSTGTIQASTASGAHASIASSNLNGNKSVNRTWTLTNGVALTGLTSYSPTFTFVSGDLVGSPTTNSFIVGKYNSSAWTYPTVGTKTSTSTQATTITTYGSFAIAEGKSSSSISITDSVNNYSYTYNGSAQGPSTSSVTGSTGAVTYSYVGVAPTIYVASATAPTAAGSYTVTATVAADANYLAASSSATAFTIGVGTTTWTSASGGSWSNETPNLSLNAIISYDYNFAGLTANTLTVNNSAVVVIPSGYNVTLNGALTVSSGSFTLNNNTNLIQTDASAVNTGNIIVKRQSAKIVRLDHTLWSSPVTGQNLYGFSSATLTNRFYTYNTVTNLYDSSSINANTQFSPAYGFAIISVRNLENCYI